MCVVGVGFEFVKKQALHSHFLFFFFVLLVD